MGRLAVARDAAHAEIVETGVFEQAQEPGLGETEPAMPESGFDPALPVGEQIEHQHAAARGKPRRRGGESPRRIVDRVENLRQDPEIDLALRDRGLLEIAEAGFRAIPESGGFDLRGKAGERLRVGGPRRPRRARSA